MSDRRVLAHRLTCGGADRSLEDRHLTLSSYSSQRGWSSFVDETVKQESASFLFATHEFVLLFCSLHPAPALFHRLLTVEADIILASLDLRRRREDTWQGSVFSVSKTSVEGKGVLISSSSVKQSWLFVRSRSGNSGDKDLLPLARIIKFDHLITERFI